MPTVTAIKPARTGTGRLSIFVDRRWVMTVDPKVVHDLDLHVGQAWTDALATRAANAKAFEKAMRRAMNRLDRRAFSRRAMERALRRADHEPEIVEAVLERLESLGLIDDEALGRSLIRSMREAKPTGPRRLRWRLIQKGLDRDLADRLVRDVEREMEPDEEAERAAELIRKRLRSMGSLEPHVRRRRLYGLLARRGYLPDVIERALRKVPEIAKR